MDGSDEKDCGTMSNLRLSSSVCSATGMHKREFVLFNKLLFLFNKRLFL